MTTDYLDKFPYIAPSDFKVTGEATPGYLYCLTCPTYILKYIPRIRFLFSLRNPVVREPPNLTQSHPNPTQSRPISTRWCVSH